MEIPGSERSVENNSESHQFTTDNLNFEYGFSTSARLQIGIQIYLISHYYHNCL